MGASSSTTSRRSTSGILLQLTSMRRSRAPIASAPPSRQDGRMSDKRLLVDPGWVRAHPEARLVDLRWTPGGPPARKRYEEGHLPGAAFVDLDADLSRPGGPGRHPFPSEEQFAQVLSRLGIGP